MGYRLHLAGWVSEVDLNHDAPQSGVVISASPQKTCLSLICDQAGLVGMLRYLHGRGLVILSVERISTGRVVVPGQQ